MAEKGDVSFPAVLVVTMIIIAIVIALVYVFIFNTKVKLEDAFGSLTKSISTFACDAMGPVKGTICPR